MEPWTKRTYVRAAFAAVLALLSGLTTAAIDGAISLQEGLTVATATLTVAGAWLGVGSQSNTIEPFYFNDQNDDPVKVPPPPATKLVPEGK